METVGRLAGVSQVTVSRALNNPKKVSPQTLKRIQDAIAVTGYVPNLVAGALASRRSHLVAALVPSITNIVYSGLMKHFIDVIRASGYHVLMSETGFSQEEEQAIVAALLSRRPDGLLLTGIHHSAGTRRMLLSAGIPVVEIWDITDTPVDICIGFSHIKAGHDVADFARMRGYHRAAAVAANDERALRRKDAFCARFSELTKTDVPEICLDSAASISRGREALARLVAQGFDKGVIFCSSDLLAHGIIIEAQSRHLNVPQDIAVIGFGDQDFSAHTLPPITTVHVDREILGARAADALLSRMNGNDANIRCIDVGFEIIARDSA
ncbi:LacI family DNA-binding transcriptional regulator [Thalassospira sp.]|uniref:LacI family DNA-binding transcriptional regulator n=1 Tax=Thalassospira sp. TaxID=1912094 RepID=UPI00273416D9|nr:LacI family DNA-binding transcriptional regulator [Thalassospira sp.]